MNDMATHLGLTDTHYFDPSGLIDTNVSSAYDISHLISFAASDPRLGTIMRTNEYVVQATQRQIPIHSTNKLLTTDMDVVGGKTGFIRKAGYCLATLLQIPQGGSQVAVVVLGAANSATRFWEARHLFNWVVGKAGGIIGDDDGRVAPGVIKSKRSSESAILHITSLRWAHAAPAACSMVASESGAVGQDGWPRGRARRLPQALARLGHRATIVLPRYRGIEGSAISSSAIAPTRATLSSALCAIASHFYVHGEGTPVRTVFVDCPASRSRWILRVGRQDFPDNADRFAVLPAAALDFAERERFGPGHDDPRTIGRAGLVPDVASASAGTLAAFRRGLVMTIHNPRIRASSAKTSCRASVSIGTSSRWRPASSTTTSVFSRPASHTAIT